MNAAVIVARPWSDLSPQIKAFMLVAVACQLLLAVVALVVWWRWSLIQIWHVNYLGNFRVRILRLLIKIFCGLIRPDCHMAIKSSRTCRIISRARLFKHFPNATIRLV